MEEVFAYRAVALVVVCGATHAISSWVPPNGSFVLVVAAIVG
jgi:hypothetical protein